LVNRVVIDSRSSLRWVRWLARLRSTRRSHREARPSIEESRLRSN
jgi:hypothetical protein